MKGSFQILFLTIVAATSLYSQNSHYWTQQYGNESLLLSGAVAGSVTDLGAVYYNPGFLSLQDSAPSFVVTAKVMQYTRVHLENGLGKNVNLEKNNLGNASGLIAGGFTLGFMPKSKFVYSVLTRRSQNIDLDYINHVNFDVLPISPGSEDFSSDITLYLESSETWGGISWSIPLNEHMSIGISNYMAIAYTNSLLSIDLNTLAADNHVVALNRIRQYDYLNFGMIWKAGLALKYPKFTAGIAITAPKINFWGQGYMYTQGILAGTDSNYTTQPEDYYESDYQQDIPAVLKSPLSVSIGTGFQIKKFRFNISAEWFDNVSKYTVMEPAVFMGQSTGEPVINNVVDELKTVVNAGFGFKYELNQNYDLYMGFSTDFSAASPSSKTFTDLAEGLCSNSTSYLLRWALPTIMVSAT